MTFSVYIGSVYFLFIFFFVGWDQNLNVNILGEFSVKIGFFLFWSGRFLEMLWGSHKTSYMFWVFNVEKGTILHAFWQFLIFFGGGGGGGSNLKRTSNGLTQI